MNRFYRIARLLTLAATSLMPGALCLPVATTGCGCKCDWEGGQSIELVSAAREGARVYLELNVTGTPCCAGDWSESEIVRIDLAKYTGGNLAGIPVDDLAGNELTIGPNERVELPDLGWAIEPGEEVSLSVLDTAAWAYQIVSLATGEVAGSIKVPVGDAIP